MNLLKKISLLFVLIGALFFSAANADEYSNPYNDTELPSPTTVIYNGFQSPYLSVNAGAAYAGPMNYQTQRYSASGLRGEAANAFLGDQINSYFGLELGFNAMDYPTMGSVFLMSLNTRLTIPIDKRFSLFGKIGPGIAESTTCNRNHCTTTSTTVPVFGGGLGYGFASRWMATLEYNGTYMPQSTGNGEGNFGALTLGATYYFPW